ncbi:unnamed protein product [Microthlaspi erraticum]|uniref:F-box domain-containing protein n=1 Tax=Microthlaspi erraticum TaxID=1685480 RepID=A0A6D2L8A9_9BRAS|nr:unnamed protein product [Microthlaspi erraticum]CAA7055855.1 unnamed protein product [Microthlaspi erraticum]
MADVEENPNLIYLHPNLLEDIFLELPLKSILKFKAVSKQWRSILESRSFADTRMKLEKQKKPKLLAVENRRSNPPFEVVAVYVDRKPPLQSAIRSRRRGGDRDGSVNILNPATGESVSFPSGPEPVNERYRSALFHDKWCVNFPGFWAMGFGRDVVNGSYKVSRMCFEPSHLCEILDVSVGEWRRVNPPPCKVEPRRKGSLYWIEMRCSDSVLALDLHTEEFRLVPYPPTRSEANQLVNLEDRLALAIPYTKPEWKFDVWVMDEQEETWSLAYSIRLAGSGVFSYVRRDVWFRPVAVTKGGNVFFHDNEKRLFRYDTETDQARCIATEISVVSGFVENVVSLRPSAGSETSEYSCGFQYQDLFRRQESERAHKFSWIKSRIPDILLTTGAGVVSLFMFHYFAVSSRRNKNNISLTQTRKAEIPVTDWFIVFGR